MPKVQNETKIKETNNFSDAFRKENEKLRASGFLFTLHEFDNKSQEEMSAYFEQNTCHAILDNATLPIRIYDPKDIEFTDAYAYAHDGFFYLYRGSCMRSIRKGPGIFWDPEKNEYYMVEVDRSNPAEVDKYKISAEHLINFDQKKILEDLKNNNKEIYSAAKNTSKAYIPKLLVTDDPLKRATKMFLIEKGIDIDQYRDRFSDKNATFNYKQVIKGDGKLSILLFERGLEAFGLNCILTIEEIDPKNPIGKALEKPIVVSFDDTYDL